MAKNIRLISIAVASFVFMTACAVGPTSRTVDGKWEVSENICSSDPKSPDLGDMRSEIRQNKSDTSGERKIRFYHLDRTILSLNEKFNYRSRVGDLTIYQNSDGNPIVETRKVRNNREVNKGVKQAVEDFFKNDSSIDGKTALSFCLFRGQ